MKRSKQPVKAGIFMALKNRTRFVPKTHTVTGGMVGPCTKLYGNGERKRMARLH